MHPLLNKVLDPPLANIYNDNDNHDKSNGYTHLLLLLVIIIKKKAKVKRVYKNKLYSMQSVKGE